MASEATLKKKWRKHAQTHGISTRSLSPHQIPGLPDIYAVDTAASDVMRDYKRTRGHWVEAKVVDQGPSAFKATRDATPKQIEWMLFHHECGVPCYWLLLGEDHWMIVPADTLEVSRERWKRERKKYGVRVKELEEPEVQRKKMMKEAAKRIQEVRARVAALVKESSR